MLLLSSAPIAASSPISILLTAPSILIASLMIAWGAESAQFFMAQGIALAILAWMQTLPEFAVEAVLAWHQQTPFLLANLTGAIRLLIGLGWPMIYFACALAYRKREGRPMRAIELHPQQCVQVVGQIACLLYAFVMWFKGSLGVIDAAILCGIYGGYLYVLRHMPAEDQESMEDLGRIPRAVVTARRPVRIAAIFGLFAVGGVLIFFTAEPFLASLFALATTLGVSSFIFIQWVAPFISEFPEFVSAFYWARSIDRASMALMNMVSSNITQWTLLAAMLPVVLSISVGHAASIPFDSQQSLEILMTLGQSLVGALFLLNMELAWWEVLILFALWAIQFAFSIIGGLAMPIHHWITAAYFVWSGIEIVRLIGGWRKANAIICFVSIWRERVAD